MRVAPTWAFFGSTSDPSRSGTTSDSGWSEGSSGSAFWFCGTAPADAFGVLDAPGRTAPGFAFSVSLFGASVFAVSASGPVVVPAAALDAVAGVSGSATSIGSHRTPTARPSGSFLPLSVLNGIQMLDFVPATERSLRYGVPSSRPTSTSDGTPGVDSATAFRAPAASCDDLSPERSTIER